MFHDILTLIFNDFIDKLDLKSKLLIFVQTNIYFKSTIKT